MPWHPAIEKRISENGNGRGWYWEVFTTPDHEVIARGVAATHAAADAQAADAARGLHHQLPEPLRRTG